MHSRKGVQYDCNGTIISCLFCRICERTEPATIVAENNKFIAFKTIAPATNNHLLISPKHHIQNFNSLRSKSDAKLIEEMVEVSGTNIITYILNVL
jgi:diadenosine tetraphosphate (Ap4A) HIT family hydrolase